MVHLSSCSFKLKLRYFWLLSNLCTTMEQNQVASSVNFSAPIINCKECNSYEHAAT